MPGKAHIDQYIATLKLNWLEQGAVGALHKEEVHLWILDLDTTDLATGLQCFCIQFLFDYLINPHLNP